MTDETTRATVPADLEEATALLAEMRTRAEEAAVEIERLTAELVDRSRALDELETIMDAVLGVTDTAVVLVGEDRRVRAMTRGAVERLGARDPQVGRPLSALLPDDLAKAVGAALDREAGEGEGGDRDRGGDRARGGGRPAGDATVRGLSGGKALVVLRCG